VDSSDIRHLSFYEDNADLLFAASSDHVRLWNVETNKQLDCLSLPPKTITDMKVAPHSGESGLLLVSAIQKETISIYFSHLSNINFDESIDMLPTNIVQPPKQQQDVSM
jgi:WD40 repeat protein